MIVVMNVVNVADGRAGDFERAFLTRERLLSQAEGFRGFDLLRRDNAGEYLVMTRWDSHDDFKAWLGSDLFRRSHSRRGDGQLTQSSELRTYEVLDVEVPA